MGIESFYFADCRGRQHARPYARPVASGQRRDARGFPVSVWDAGGYVRIRGPRSYSGGSCVGLVIVWLGFHYYDEILLLM